MSEITIADTAEYASHKKSQVYGVLLGTLIPLCIVAEFNNSFEREFPEILNSDQATTLCLQEGFENTSLTEQGFHLNLSSAEIETCAATKIAQSEQIQQDYIQSREDNQWKFMALAGVFSAACLALAGHGFVSNRRLRKEKPGIETMKPPGRFSALRHEL